MIVNEEHFRYLYVQRGEVSDAYAAGGSHGGFKAWKLAFDESTSRVMAALDVALPADARSILDVGGGLGWLGVLLSRRYPSASYWVLDGANDTAEVRKHGQSFSNAAVSADFLRVNGVKEFGHYAPDVQDFGRKFDLVVSTASWGFHIEPQVYLRRVADALAPGATVILEVRRTHWKWIEAFQKVLGNPTIFDIGKKHVRLAWRT